MLVFLVVYNLSDFLSRILEIEIKKHFKHFFNLRLSQKLLTVSLNITILPPQFKAFSMPNTLSI